MLPQFSRFNSNRKGIVLKCSKFHKLVSFDQHQIFQPPCPPGASSSSSMPLPLARSLVVRGAGIHGNRHDAILRATPFAFYERPAEAVPESSWIDRQKMYHQKWISEIDPESWKYHPSTKFQTNDLGQRASSLVTSRFSNWLSVSSFLCFWASWLGDSSSRGWMNRTDGRVGLWRHADTVDCWCTVETLTF